MTASAHSFTEFAAAGQGARWGSEAACGHSQLWPPRRDAGLRRAVWTRLSATLRRPNVHHRRRFDVLEPVASSALRTFIISRKAPPSTLGNSRWSSSIVSTRAAATMSRANHLLSAGITYHGASGVDV